MTNTHGDNILILQAKANLTLSSSAVDRQELLWDTVNRNAEGCACTCSGGVATWPPVLSFFLPCFSRARLEELLVFPRVWVGFCGLFTVFVEHKEGWLKPPLPFMSSGQALTPCFTVQIQKSLCSEDSTSVPHWMRYSASSPPPPPQFAFFSSYFSSASLFICLCSSSPALLPGSFCYFMSYVLTKFHSLRYNFLSNLMWSKGASRLRVGWRHLS